jgi:hypothetical protein
MNLSLRPVLKSIPVIALGLAAGLTLARPLSAEAARPAAVAALDDKLPASPLVVSFEKVTDAEGGPYVLKLTNSSGNAVTAGAKIFPSVTIHSDTKERDLPKRSIAAGDVWSIPGLAATDKITVETDGFAPLEITVP